MIGLSIVLEAQKSVNKKPPQVINKATMIKPSPSLPPPPPPSPSPSPSLPSSSSSSSSRQSWRWNSSPSTTFLDECFLCKHKLLPGKDIYMYKGDRAFCSVECRCRHIFMDEEESVRRENCSFTAIKPTYSASTSGSSSSASRHRHHRKGTGNRAGGFAY